VAELLLLRLDGKRRVQKPRPLPPHGQDVTPGGRRAPKESAPSQWVLDGGPVDAWQSETWPRPGRP